MAETFTKASLSEPQVEGYIIGLEDLSVHEIVIGCKRVLRRWNFTSMPPPAYIRECVAAAMEEERNRAPMMPKYPPIERLTLEEAWEDWEISQQITKEAREKIGAVAAQKKAELKKSYGPAFAPKERVAELQRQKEAVRKKYAK